MPAPESAGAVAAGAGLAILVVYGTPYVVPIITAVGSVIVSSATQLSNFLERTQLPLLN